MTLSIDYDHDRSEAGPLFELRFGQLAGVRVVHKIARGGAEAERLLRNEITIGQRLRQQFGNDYPDQLAMLMGSGEDPLNVVMTYRGVPVQRQEGLPREETILLLFADVLRGLSALARLGLTHGGITPETVLWEPAQDQYPGRAQLIDFGRVTPRGRPRDMSLPPVWCAPPPGDVAHPGHDIYQAALVVHTVATQEPPSDAAGMRARLADGPNDFLRRLLAGTFADDPELRPDALQLLDRVSGFQMTAPITLPRPAAAPSSDARGFSPPFTYSGTRHPGTQHPGTQHPGTQHPGTQYSGTPVAGANPRLDFRRMVAEKRAFRQRQQNQVAVARRFVRDLIDLLWYRQASMRARLALVGLVFAALAVLVFLFLQLIGA